MLRKSIKDMAEVYKEYSLELHERLKEVREIASAMKEDARVAGDKFYHYFDCYYVLNGFYSRDGFGVVDGDFVGIDDCYEDNGVHEICAESSWIFDDNYLDVAIAKLNEYKEKRTAETLEVRKKREDNSVKDALEVLRKAGYKI